MADSELVKILRRGSKAWNTWRGQQPENLQLDLSDAKLSSIKLSTVNLNGANLTFATLIRANLSDANMCKTSLFRADLRNADLRYANLSYANISDAILQDADLRFANLTNVDLSNTDLRLARLSYADFSNADLSGADLSHANLNRAILSQATMNMAIVGSTQLDDIDLRMVKGLETIKHISPSSIGFDTIIRSQGDIPEIFLRGVGVSDTFIAYSRSLINIPIDYYTCFISYSSKDEGFAERLYADLQSRGVRCWFAPHHMQIGNKIRAGIDDAIHMQDRLLLVLSEHSIASDWVEHEVETALARERRDKRTILFPIRLDAVILARTHTGWPALVQNERHIGDFTGWKDHDRYQIAFERLLHDLKKADK